MSAQVLLAGLAHPRSQWPRSLARWSTSGELAAEFLLCLSSQELLAALASGRNFDAVLIDDLSGQAQRDLLSAVRGHGSTVIGVDETNGHTDWDALGVSVILRGSFDSEDLMLLLRRVCTPHTSSARLAVRADLGGDRPRATTIAVCGAGGAGASSVSMAIAQAMCVDDRAEPSEPSPRVTLVDGAARGHLAMYHDAGDVIPNLGDLVGLARTTDVPAAEVSEIAQMTSRGYRLVMGTTSVREARGLTPAASAGAIDAVRRVNDVVVVDHDSDMGPGAISTALVERTSVWVIVTVGKLRGVHEGARLVAEAIDAGVPSERIVVMCNQTRRSDASRATFSVNLNGLIGSERGPVRTVFVPLARLEPAHHEATPLPPTFANPCAAAVRRVLRNVGKREETSDAPILVQAMG